MIYNPSKQLDVSKAIEKLKFFISKQQPFELKAKKPTRSLNQNRYLHLIIGWYALEYGETMEYIKQEVFKKQVNRSIFKTEYINRITGEIREDYRSTADLDTQEMTMAIDRFRNYASKEAGIYLPEPSDLTLLQEIDIQISNNQHYL